MQLRFRLPAVTDAPEAARHALDGHLDHVGRDAQETIRLALSELVSNVVRHAGMAADDKMTVLVDDRSGPVLVAVEQPTRAPATIVPTGARAGDGGHGLRIVDHLADRWGVFPARPGAVWFEVAPSARES